MKKFLLLLMSLLLVVVATGCGDNNGTNKEVASTIDNINSKKKLVVGTAPGYLPFDMKDKKGNFIGYDIDVARAIGKSLGVEVEFKQFDFDALIPALQTGDIDMILAGMTIRGDRAKAVSFSNPYYATGQLLMVPASDTTTTNYKQLDQAGNTIALSQGTTGALFAKDIFKKVKFADYPDFPSAGMTLIQKNADGVIYDEPAIRMFVAMNPTKARAVEGLLSKENLGIAVRLNDLNTVQWLNSFLQSYINSPDEIKSNNHWFKETNWVNQVEEKK
jgi:polar amino acid transport system substrate-binding protein